MACNNQPYHKCPVRHVGISASQNVYRSARRMIRAEAESFLYYVGNGLMPSLKFKRSADSILDGYDENKAMFPVYGNVPLFAVTSIAAIESGMDVYVAGSRDVGRIVHELSRYYASTGNLDAASRITWVPECTGLDDLSSDDRQIIVHNIKRITLSNSMTRLAKAMNLSKHDAFLFVAGDIIFYDYPSAASDTDIANHSIVLDLNGRESINPPLPRNYYHRIVRRDGKEVYFKEPNVWAIGSEFNLGLSDDTYSHAQKGGFGPKAFFKMAGKNIFYHMHDFIGREMAAVISAVFMEGASMASKKLFGKSFAPIYHEKDLERIARFVNMSPVRIKAEHSDYLRLKDVDALHDYVFVRRLVERHCDDVFPSNIASSIKGFASCLGNSGAMGEISTLAQLPEKINGKVRRIQRFLDKKKVAHKIELPFDSRGNLQAEPRKDESLEKAVERSRQDLEKYYARLRHL